jgi:hypothetical protein
VTIHRLTITTVADESGPSQSELQCTQKDTQAISIPNGINVRRDSDDKIVNVENSNWEAVQDAAVNEC